MKIANAQGFWGDDLSGPRKVLEGEGDLDFLTLDFLAEVSMSIMAAQKEKDPTLGYARDFLTIAESLIPYYKGGGKCKIVTNAGGLNPIGLARELKALFKKAGIDKKVAAVSGDDVLSILKENGENPLFQHLETGERLKTQLPSLVTANAYLGKEGIKEALSLSADFIITGRTADPSLTIGPFCFHYQIPENAFDAISGAHIAGHLIECGRQVTGGISTDFDFSVNPLDLAFPVAKMQPDGSFSLRGSIGMPSCLSENTVKEQLLYEIDDPGAMICPDVISSILDLNLKETALHEVFVSGAKGGEPTPYYKVSATFRAGFRAEGTLAFFGKDCILRAKKAGKSLIQKVYDAGFLIDDSIVEVVGDGAIIRGLGTSIAPNETLLRVALRSKDKNALEYFSTLFAPFVTAGPPGTTGYTSSRAKIRPVFGYWPCLIEKNAVKIRVEIV